MFTRDLTQPWYAAAPPWRVGSGWGGGRAKEDEVLGKTVPWGFIPPALVLDDLPPSSSSSSSSVSQRKSV